MYSLYLHFKWVSIATITMIITTPVFFPKSSSSSEFAMDLSRKDNKNKSQASTKGRWTAGYLSLCQLRCLLIAADILPTLFKSKLFWCTAFFCFFPNGGHSLEMPPSPLSAENLNIWQNLLIITPFVLTVLSSFPRCSKHFWSSCMQSEVNTHRFYPLAGEKDS